MKKTTQAGVRGTTAFKKWDRKGKCTQLHYIFAGLLWGVTLRLQRVCEVTQELDTVSDSLAETSRERRQLAEKQMALEKEMVIKKGILWQALSG